MSAPIGKFGVFDQTCKWIECDPSESLRKDGTLLADCRFRPNTYLKDAEGEWIYDGDKIYSTYTKRWYTVRRKTSGAWVLVSGNFEWDGEDSGEVWSVREYLTRTPPKKYIRWHDQDGNRLDTPIEVYNQRMGVAERRMPTVSLYRGRRKGPRDRRTGEGA